MTQTATRRIEPDNDFREMERQNGEGEGMMQVAMTRAAQEVQAAMVVAKRFPRDQEKALARIEQSCQRKTLAEQAIYTYPRGGTQVEGPSIRLAEVLAQNWGNIESGVVELERRDGCSTAMAFCWDLETNTRDVKVFEVRHIRDRSERKGGSQKLTEERDIYEILANMGSRRKRACILAVIPGDIVDAALVQCNKTMQSGNEGPLIDRVRAAVANFAKHQITIDMLEKRLGHKLEATSEAELVGLKKIYFSLRDGMATRDDFFEVGENGHRNEVPMPKAKAPTNPSGDGATARTGEAQNAAPVSTEQSGDAPPPSGKVENVDLDIQSMELCESLGGTSDAYVKARDKFLLSIGKKGKIAKMTAGEWKDLQDGIKSKAGHWIFLA